MSAYVNTTDVSARLFADHKKDVDQKSSSSKIELSSSPIFRSDLSYENELRRSSYYSSDAQPELAVPSKPVEPFEDLFDSLLSDDEENDAEIKPDGKKSAGESVSTRGVASNNEKIDSKISLDKTHASASSADAVEGKDRVDPIGTKTFLDVEMSLKDFMRMIIDGASYILSLLQDKKMELEGSLAELRSSLSTKLYQLFRVITAKKIVESQEAARVAEEKAKSVGFWTNLVSKIIMAVALVISVATCGTLAGFALAAASLIVMGIDKLVGHLTGKSLTERAVKGIAEAVKWFANNAMVVLGKEFEELGKQISDSVCEIIAIVIFIIITMVVGAGIAKMATSQMATSVANMISASAKSIANKANVLIKRIFALIKKMIDAFTKKTEKVTKVFTKKMGGFVQAGQTMIQGGVQIGTGLETRKSEQLRIDAEFKESSIQANMIQHDIFRELRSSSNNWLSNVLKDSKSLATASSEMVKAKFASYKYL